jgi:hypothetical protein
MKRFVWMILFLLAGAAGLVPAAQPAAAAPLAAPSGWVQAQVVGGGCDSAGHCSSTVKPGSPTLYEYKPDRQSVGRDFAVSADRSQHGGYPTYVSRDKCHIGSVDYYWSAGIWHHGGYWTLTFDAAGREHWSGPSSQHWAFEHSDTCVAIPTPTVVPTSVPPTPMPGAPTWTPVPPTPLPTATPIPDAVCHPDGQTEADRVAPDYSIWTPSAGGLALPTSAPGLRLQPSVALTFSQNPLNAAVWPGSGWDHQYLTLAGPVAGQLVWRYTTGTDHGTDTRYLTLDASATSRFSGPQPAFFNLPRLDPSRPPISFRTTLSGLPDGQYSITSQSHQTACNPHQRTVTFYFTVGAPPAVATATPPAPAPPVPGASFTLSIHSTLDPNNGDADARNAVYTSSGSQIAWPAGEVLDFTPRVRMTLSPSAPAYAGYRFQAHVRDWSLVSSLGQLASSAPDALGRAGCRGGGRQTSGVGGPVCTYAYIGGTSLSDATAPTEADMATQAHVYWAASAPRSMRPDVYAYALGQLQQADLRLEVRIVVEVVNVTTGAVVASRTDTASGTFGVSLVVPRSAK